MKLSDYLQSNDISQADFARLIGETPQNVFRYKEGRIPSRKSMRKIARVTEGAVTANDFYEIAEADQVGVEIN